MFNRHVQVGDWAVLFALFAFWILLAVPVMAADTQDSPVDALKNGNVSLNLRYRFENVHDRGFDDDGHASTLRTALGYTTAPWRGLLAKVEFQGVVDIGTAGKYNNKGSGAAWNGVMDRPTIADPDQVDFHQAYLDWEIADGTKLRFGRQEILFDNVRFVGNVGWRQFHQSFDAGKLITRVIPRTTLVYAFVYNQNRIFADTRRMASHLLHLTWDLKKAGNVNAYGYLIDYDRIVDSGLSTVSYGLRWHGGAGLGKNWTGFYDLEIARQNDAGDNPNRVNAGYYRATLGARRGIWTLKGGYEILEGSPADGAFTTPFATLHAWNGWADRFLKTPPNGLQDGSLSLGAKFSPWKLMAVYHDFRANTGGAHYGSEYDFLTTWASPWKQTFALKAAAYIADELSRDVTKIWAFTSWKF